MAITISRLDDRYVAEVSPPHGGGIPWATDEPMGARELVRALTAHGCHQTDIGDAFYAADDAWLLRLENEQER
jgi:hypothetical protein